MAKIVEGGKEIRDWVMRNMHFKLHTVYTFVTIQVKRTINISSTTQCNILG